MPPPTPIKTTSAVTTATIFPHKPPCSSRFSKVDVFLPSLVRRRIYSLFAGGGLTVGFESNHCRGKLAKASALINSDGILDEILEESEFNIDELSGFRGLVLDISYRRATCDARPVNVVCWKRAICLEFMDKVDVLEYYDQTVNSPSGSFYIPAVLRVPHLLQVVKRRRVKRGLSRKNIFCRDNYTCQYCSSMENLTIDHVLPIARGGQWTWENLVAACAYCNSKKGQKTPEEANMKLSKVPKAPKDFDILAIPLTHHAMKMLKMKKGLPEEWRQYLSKPFAAGP